MYQRKCCFILLHYLFLVFLVFLVSRNFVSGSTNFFRNSSHNSDRTSNHKSSRLCLLGTNICSTKKIFLFLLVFITCDMVWEAQKLTFKRADICLTDLNQFGKTQALKACITLFLTSSQPKIEHEQCIPQKQKKKDIMKNQKMSKVN